MCTSYKGLESHRLDGLYINESSMYSNSSFSASLKRKPFVYSKRK